MSVDDQPEILIDGKHLGNNADHAVPLGPHRVLRYDASSELDEIPNTYRRMH